MNNNSLTPGQIQALRNAPRSARPAMRQRFALQRSQQGGRRNTGRQNNNTNRVNNMNVNPNIRNRSTALQTVPRNLPFLEPRAILMPFTSMSVAIVQTNTGSGNTTVPTHSIRWHMRPSRQHMEHMAQVYSQHRYHSLQYRFVGNQPSTTTISIVSGYTATVTELPYNQGDVATLDGVIMSRADRTSQWATMISPRSALNFYRANALSTEGGTATNSSGVLHIVLSGAAHNQTAGHMEFRGRVEFSGPCRRS